MLLLDEYAEEQEYLYKQKVYKEMNYDYGKSNSNDTGYKYIKFDPKLLEELEKDG